MIEPDEGHMHLALSEYAFGASVEEIRRRYGVEVCALNRGILLTSAMPILDNPTLSMLEREISGTWSGHDAQGNDHY